MITTIHNEEFGADVACYGKWVVVANPDFVLFNPATESVHHTGSVQVFKYNVNTDQHDLKPILYRPFSPDEEILLAAEDDNILHTELTGTFPITADLDLLIDPGLYFTASGDDFGCSVDVNRNLLAVGCRYWNSDMNFPESGVSYHFSGSSEVYLYDLSKLDIDPYATVELVSITSQSLSASNLVFHVSVPAGQGYGNVVLLGKENPGDPYLRLQSQVVSSDGGMATLTIDSASHDSFTSFSVTGIIETDPYLMTIFYPVPTSGSFGYAVSLNDEWLAISDPLNSSTGWYYGAVHLYRKPVGGNDTSWVYSHYILSPAGIVSTASLFGHSLDLNKATGSYSWSLVVGSLKESSSNAYVYQYDEISDSWYLKQTLSPDTAVKPLTFYSTDPVVSASYGTPRTDGFGSSVAIWGDTVIVGAPTDRAIYEYSGSSPYLQGAVYIFELCPDGSKYYLVKKSYGDENIIKNNKLGYSVSVWGDRAVAGVPKTNISSSTCYLRGSLFQKNYCPTNNEDIINGQFILFQKNTSSLDWDIYNTYQVKKRFLSPHRTYGYNIDICDSCIVVGAPMRISGSDRIIDMNNTGSWSGDLTDLGDLTGKAYIYNLKNLRDKFYVGNVFYRNGKIVVMTSGSYPGTLVLTNNPGEEYEYEIDFTSRYTLFEKQIMCPVEPGEFNVSTNPSAIVLPTSSFDINQSGVFDFQDCDILLQYMQYQRSATVGTPNTNWSSSVLVTDDEISFYNYYSSSYTGTTALFEENYADINNTLFNDLDFNQDNLIDLNDMNILWKYFSNRLTQKNYNTYITPNSARKYLGDILDFINGKTNKGKAPDINTDFLDANGLSIADPTGSYLYPCVTAIGLYSGTELVAVAKLGSPIRLIPDFPFNFIVKMDF